MTSLWILLFLLAINSCSSQDGVFQAQRLLRQYRSQRQDSLTPLQKENFRDFWKVFQSTPQSQLDGRQCFRDLATVLSDLNKTEEYAFYMLDSYGSAQTGMLIGNWKWLGFYEECVEAKKIVDGEVKIQGKHCRLPGEGQIIGVTGICVPHTCSAGDLEQLYPIPANTSINCVEDVPWITGDYVTIGICSAICLVLAIGTLLDVFLRISKEKSSREKKLSKQEEPNNIQLTSLKSIEHPIRTPKYDNASGISNAAGLDNKGYSSERDSIPQHMEKIQQNGQIHENAKVNGHAPNVHENGNAFIVHQNKVLKSVRDDLEVTRKQSFGQKVLLCFSVLTNGEKLFNFSSPRGQLTCINGIRALSFGWVILGHVYAFALAFVDNPLQFDIYLKKPAFQLIIQGTYSVDTFFFLSGLLVAYTAIKVLNKNKGSMNWPLYYIHRYFRLTILYGFTILFIATLYRHITKGIFQNAIAEGTLGSAGTVACQKYWWTNILYINNFYPKNVAGCHGVGWYMANDMQFFIFTPIYVYLLYRKPIIGHIYVLKSIVIAFIATGVVSSKFDLTSLMFGSEEENFDQQFYSGALYIRPYYRMGAYLVGLSTAEFLINKPKLNKVVIAVGWVLALGLHYTLLFGMYPYYRDDGTSMSRDMDALYNATHRTVWAISLGWIVFACAHGFGGPINWFLSWNIWGPIARLSFAGYLCHPMVMDVINASLQHMMRLNDFSMSVLFMAFTTATLLVSAVLSICIEAPIMRLQKLLLGDK